MIFNLLIQGVGGSNPVVVVFCFFSIGFGDGGLSSMVDGGDGWGVWGGTSLISWHGLALAFLRYWSLILPPIRNSKQRGGILLFSLMLLTPTNTTVNYRRRTRPSSNMSKP